MFLSLASDPTILALIGIGTAMLASAALSAASGAYSASQAEGGNAAAAGVAYRRQKALQEIAYQNSREFRQTAHQDTTADLEAAGLNRILSISQGPTSGAIASTPQAPHAVGSGSSSQAAGAATSRSVSAAAQVASQIGVQKAQANLLTEQAQESTARKIKIIEEAVNTAAARPGIHAQSKTAKLNALQTSYATWAAKISGDFYRSNVGKAARISQEVGKSVGSLLGAPHRRLQSPPPNLRGR